MIQATRIKTHHGVYVPPWKETPMGKTMTFVFTIDGRIRSKKNELKAVVDRSDAFKYLNELVRQNRPITPKECTAMLFKTYGRVVNCKEYEAWEADLVKKLISQRDLQQPTAEKNGVIFPVPSAKVKIRYYWANVHRHDNTNKGEGIMDALVKAQIILDDSDKVAPDTSQQSRNYKDEIVNNIVQVYVTVPIR